MKVYRIECGGYSETWNTRELAEYHCKRIGLARCEEARVIDTDTGEVVYEF